MLRNLSPFVIFFVTLFFMTSQSSRVQALPMFGEDCYVNEAEQNRAVRNSSSENARVGDIRSNMSNIGSTSTSGADCSRGVGDVGVSEKETSSSTSTSEATSQVQDDLEAVKLNSLTNVAQRKKHPSPSSVAELFQIEPAVINETWPDPDTDSVLTS